MGLDYFKQKALEAFNNYSISAVVKYNPYVNEYRFCFNRKGVTFYYVTITTKLLTIDIDRAFDDAYRFYGK